MFCYFFSFYLSEISVCQGSCKPRSPVRRHTVPTWDQIGRWQCTGGWHMKTAPSCSCARCRGAVTKPRVSTTCEPIGRGCMAPLGLRVRNCAHCRCWRTLPWTGTEWTLESAVRLCPPCGCQSGACPIATSIPCLSGCRWSCRGSSRSGSLQPHSSIPLWAGLSQRPQRSFRQRTPASQGNRMQPRWRQKSRVRPPKKDRQFRGPSVSQKGQLASVHHHTVCHPVPLIHHLCHLQPSRSCHPHLSP